MTTPASRSQFLDTIRRSSGTTPREADGIITPASLGRRAKMANQARFLSPEARASMNATWRSMALPVMRGHFGHPDCTQRGLFDHTGFGDSLSPSDQVLPDLLDSVVRGGKGFSTLGLSIVKAKSTKAPNLTVRPASAFIVNDGDTFPDDSDAAGNASSSTIALAGNTITMSRELFEDAEADLAEQVVQTVFESLGLLYDGAFFSGTGAASSVYGGITGITVDAATVLVTAAAGNTQIALLDEADIISMITAVDASALQHGCSFWAHPSFLGPLMNVKDASGARVVQSTIDDEGNLVFTLLGFPLELTGGMPSANTAGSKVLCFGRGAAYNVSLRQDFEIMASPHVKFNRSAIVFRTVLRAGGKMRRGQSFSCLKLPLT